MQLSEHFALAELKGSPKARQLKLDNEPDPETIGRLTRSAVLLERVRTALNDTPMTISSGYRSPALNKAVGGSPTSAHCLGYAIDFISPDFGAPFAVCNRILEAGISFDQLIHEYGRWIHISFDPRMRRQAMTIASLSQGYLAGIREVRT